MEAAPESEARCLDCGLDYSLFPLDVVLPRAQWLTIHPDEHGLLCAACIVQRASKVSGATVVHAIIEISPKAGKCATCAHLRQFDLTKDYFNCPIVNIRVSAYDVRHFGCALWEQKKELDVGV